MDEFERFERAEALYETLQHRQRPEAVAKLVIEELGDELSDTEQKLLARVASEPRGWHTAMSEDFRTPVIPATQVARAAELFSAVLPPLPMVHHELVGLQTYVRRLAKTIGKVEGRNDFKADRNRREMAPKLSRRQYNKRFRFLTRFEKKLRTYEMELRKYDAGRIAKSGLATKISFKDFAASREAACFVAYYTARRNRRSIFTNEKQDRAFDTVSEMLLERFKAWAGNVKSLRGDGRVLRAVKRVERQEVEAGWRAIARVLPEAAKELSAKDRAALWGQLMATLHELADLLRQTWERSQFKRETMIVERGDDSSTWNALAGAWNAVRQSWLATTLAMGAEAVVEACCFGKVMRLMAADVAARHRLSGGQLEPDTLVWADLPAPWEVFAGKMSCTRQDVEAACAARGVNPSVKGWTAQPTERTAVPFKPTPELVHGVAVAHPELVPLLKKAGWFSGKRLKALPKGTKVAVEYEERGFVVVAKLAAMPKKKAKTKKHAPAK